MSRTRKYIQGEMGLLDRFIDLVVQGKKTSTIRYGLVFVTDDVISLVSDRRRVRIRILGLDYSKKFADLDERDARLEGFQSVSEMKAELEMLYDGISPDDPVTIIRFRKLDDGA